MTPLIGIVIAVLAALLAPNVRALVFSVVTLMAVATAIQSWDLGSGMGSNPPDTIQQVSYWVVQVIIISIITGVALATFALRRRRAARRDQSLARPAFSGRRGLAVLGVAVLAVTGVGLVWAYTHEHMVKHHGVGAGNIPATGIVGIVIGLIALVVLGVVLVTGTRSGSRAEVPA
jgi:hypothetical protein